MAKSHYYYVVYDKEKGLNKLDYVDGPYNSFAIVRRIAKEKNRLEGYQRFIAKKVRAEDPITNSRSSLLKKLRKGIRGTVRISKGRLIIKT